MSDKKNDRKKTVVGGTLTWGDIFKPGQKFGKFGVTMTVDAATKDSLLKETKAMANKALSDFLAEKPEFAEEAKAWKVTLPITPGIDKKTRKPTGEFIFKANRDATWTDKKVSPPKVHNVVIPVVDAKKQAVAYAKIGGGSVVRVAVLLKPYVRPNDQKFGVSASLDAVQIIKLVEFGGDATSAFSEEDGFEASEGGDHFSDTSSSTPAAAAPAAGGADPSDF